MPSIGSIINTARNAIHAHQTAVTVTAQNVANAQTPGYTRQKVVMVAAAPEMTPQGMFGTGVLVEDVDRVRDALIDVSFRRESGRAASYGLRHDILGQIEGVLGEPSETGISAALDAFWSSWSDLSTQPASSAARAMVRQSGEEVVSRLNRMAGQISDIEDSVKIRLAGTVAELNELSREVADINVSIVAAESAGGSAPDLRDARDRLIDRMSQLGSVRVLESSTGSATVLVDGETVVDGSTVREIQGPFLEDGQTVLRVAGSRMTSPSEGSALGEMVRLLNQDFGGSTGVRARLDELAAGLVSRVNQLHRQGWSAAGEALGGGSWGGSPTGSMVDFFDPAGVTARGLALSEAVQANPAVIAAGYTRNAGTDNRLALDLAALRDATDSMSGGTRSFAAFHGDTVTDLALRVGAAENSSSVYETLASQAENRRQSVSGVSTDEELIRLMQHQQAYTAASKLLKAADEMLQALLNL